MKRFFSGLPLCLLFLLAGCSNNISVSDLENAKHIADKNTYLEDVCIELSKKWPNNKTVNIVCHGHSVPAGYFKTPVVNTFESYPHLFHKGLKENYPYAVINVITTAIGEENSISGAERFETEVLNHNPDVVLIDYGLNDRPVGLEESGNAWSEMIEKALSRNIKVLLLTPTLDINHVPDDKTEDLNLHAEQIRFLAKKYNVGLVDSLYAHDCELKKGVKAKDLLSNESNHPNRKGHEIVAAQILKWFLLSQPK